ncbi:MAG: recombination protein RecR [Lentisphaeria bacterium]|nr:recombination protein RecR [Lentisphaeria bacterium]
MEDRVQYPEILEDLINYFKLLPGVGRRGAERMVLSMLEWESAEQREFGSLLASLPERISSCPDCGAVAVPGEKCEICSDLRRDRSLLCVVETMSQLFAVEKGGCYRGCYLVLGGRISPLDGEDGSSLNIPLLLRRAAEPETREVILALSSDVEGRATAAFLAEVLADLPVKLTRPALGLPAGANLSFADGATIAAAFSGRKGVE